MKRRVFSVFNGQQRLCKDVMMLDQELEVRLELNDSGAYVTDLDVETLKRAQAFHAASAPNEPGGWTPVESGPPAPIS